MARLPDAATYIGDTVSVSLISFQTNAPGTPSATTETTTCCFSFKKQVDSAGAFYWELYDFRVEASQGSTEQIAASR
jgi:hypothetical protein